MTNIYEKSLELMDTHFESITDEEFMHDYLSVEEFQGPLVRDFLSDFYSYTGGREIDSEFDALVTTTAETLYALNMDYFISDIVEYSSESSEPVIIKRKTVNSFDFDLSYVANDENCCKLSLVA